LPVLRFGGFLQVEIRTRTDALPTQHPDSVERSFGAGAFAEERSVNIINHAKASLKSVNQEPSPGVALATLPSVPLSFVRVADELSHGETRRADARADEPGDAADLARKQQDAAPNPTGVGHSAYRSGNRDVETATNGM
jgi:hypothetical protein